ncbi:MAG: hypothetical protein HYS71_05190, partial [Candidatus Omnitrophica bacterium]|nr:hypothetical protein [Candidatus Omnitrophota bacterium]
GVRAKNRAGVFGPIAYSDGVTVLADAPPTGSIAINNGAAHTKTTAVTLTFSVTDDDGTVAQLQCSNDDVTYTPPEPYQTTLPWTLLSGDGPKTVYAKFSDAEGRWSTSVSATITLDTRPPVITITSPVDGAVIGAPP